MNIAIGTTYKTWKGLKTHHLAGLLGFACALIAAAGIIVALDNGGGSVTSPAPSKYGTFTSFAGPPVLYLIVGSAEEAARYEQEILASRESAAYGEGYWDEYHFLVVDTPEAEEGLNQMKADLDWIEKDTGIRNSRIYDMRVY